VPVKSITRLPPYAHHVPVFKLGRYHLVAPYTKAPSRNRSATAIFAYSLDEAAGFLARGYPLLMGEPGAWWGTFVGARALDIAVDSDDV